MHPHENEVIFKHQHDNPVALHPIIQGRQHDLGFQTFLYDHPVY